MKIVKDIAPITETNKYDVVLVATSIYGMLTNGFQRDIRIKYPYVHEENIKQPYADLRRLGTRLTLKREGNPVISLLYVCTFPLSDREFIDRDALRHALLTADAEFAGKKVMTTLIGASKYDGNCDRDEMMGIIKECVKKMDLYIYDREQTKYRCTGKNRVKIVKS